MKIVRSMFMIMLQLLMTAVGHAQTIPAWKLQAARDSFTIRVRGQDVGFSVVAIEATADGHCQVTENTAIGASVMQRTRMMVDGCARLASVVQSGSARGQETRIDLKYTRGHVKGSAVTPGANGTEPHVIDLDVPEHVVDVNLLQSVLSQLIWSEKSDWMIPVFSAGKNGMTDMRVKVIGEETLELAGGPVAAYKAEMKGDVVNVELWISKAAPHRVLKFVPVGSPMEMIHARAHEVLQNIHTAASEWLAELAMVVMRVALMA